ncbi:MAG: heme ABC exporter ATP-binding protein CcmA [Paracoccaceae bacterium]
MALNVENLACRRGSVAVLEGVSFELADGQALIVRGPNGSGKTTLLRTLAGLQPPVAGVLSVAPEAIAYGAHADGLKATLSVADNLEFWAAIYRTGPIDAALTAFDLAGLRDRIAHNLSAGQKRRLSLARVLVTGGAIWLLDEPTVSLDRDAIAQFGAAIGAHLAHGGSALITSHVDLGFAAATLDILQFRATSALHADGFEAALT